MPSSNREREIDRTGKRKRKRKRGRRDGLLEKGTPKAHYTSKGREITVESFSHFKHEKKLRDY